MKTFTCKQDVLDHYGVENEQQLDRRVYKDTACGAWARFVTRNKVVRTWEERWQATLQKGLADRVYVNRVIRDGGENDPLAAQRGIPDEVKQYLGIKNARGLTDIDHKGFNDLTNQGDEVVTVNSPISKTVVFTVTLNETRDTEGLLIGSIVEGSDAEVERYLEFPFTETQLNVTIADIEAETDELWDDAHPDGLP
jgi:hypothetical protein